MYRNISHNTILYSFFELIRVALGRTAQLSHTPSAEEWQNIYILSKRQALIGITYLAIERLPKEQRPQREILAQWYLYTEKIKDRNLELNNKIAKISTKFRYDGFRNIVLKGQGIASYYSVDGLELLRTPGDMDVWFDGTRDDIISYVRQYSPNCNIVYHHVDFPIIDGVHIEIHFTPSWMNCYFTNNTLQKYFTLYRKQLFEERDSDTITTPTTNFNRVYILVHIYRHLFHEGIGLRQLMDYFYVLRKGFTSEERTETMCTLTALKMARFTAAIMWVMQEVFGMEDCYLLTAPNEKDGRFLLNEIMLAGNLGKYDKRIIRKNTESNISYGIRKLFRNARFIYSYPSEVLWSPIFKIWHYFWRKKYNNNN